MKEKKKKEPMVHKSIRFPQTMVDEILEEYEELGEGVRDIVRQYLERKKKEKAA